VFKNNKPTGWYKLSREIKTNRLSEVQYVENFSDLVKPLTDKQVLVESERCLFCYDAPCITACPTGIDIPNFIRKIHTGNVHGAAKEILSANILGGSCARVCPTETLCEQKCVRNTQEEAPVSIGRLQRYAVDNIDTSLGYPFTRKPDTGKQVAIVGAGPAGLACAHKLATQGHNVILFEASEKAGGLNEYGIAKYKLVDDYAQKELDFLLQIGGIEIRHSQALGKEVSIDSLREQYNAVFISIGLNDVNALNIDGEELPGVVDAIEYIRELRQTTNLADLAVGKRVVVIGAGMTAIDIAVQSKKLGAQDVSICYRKGLEQMGASEHEQELALHHGVKFILQATPKKVNGNEDGLSSIEFINSQSSDEVIEVPCDVVFKAIGQKFNAAPISDASVEFKLDARGRIAVSEKFETSVSGVYAGGDCIDGKDLVVEAVDHGNNVALAIHAQLTQGA